PASIPPGWRNSRWRPERDAMRIGSEEIAVEYVAEPGGRFAVTAAGTPAAVRLGEVAADTLDVAIDGVRRRHRIAVDGDTTWVHSTPGTSECVAVPRFPAARR